MLLYSKKCSYFCMLKRIHEYNENIYYSHNVCHHMPFADVCQFVYQGRRRGTYTNLCDYIHVGKRYHLLFDDQSIRRD